jgi:hypothetical protein
MAERHSGQMRRHWQHRITKRKRKSEGKAEFLRHPLTLLVLGFVLSGILGTIFSQWLSRQQKQIEEEASIRQKELEKARLDEEARKIAIQNLSRFIYERRARAEMLASSIRRNADIDETRERKKLYDEAYVKWNANHQANLFLVRDVIREEEYSFFESIIEFTLVGKIFSPLDGCLTASYDTKLRGEDAVVAMTACKARVHIQQALDCGYAITNELYKISTSATDQARAANEISRRCPE